MSLSISMPATLSERMGSPSGERMPATIAQHEPEPSVLNAPIVPHGNRASGWPAPPAASTGLHAGSVGPQGRRQALRAPFSVDGMPSRERRSCSAERPSGSCAAHRHREAQRERRGQARSVQASGVRTLLAIGACIGEPCMGRADGGKPGKVAEEEKPGRSLRRIVAASRSRPPQVEDLPIEDALTMQ